MDEYIDDRAKHPIKVLIVDDSPISRDILEAIIKSDSAFEIIGFAGNGKEAIGMVEKLEPDIVTMDLNMPIMCGFDAIENIMAFNPTPILVVTTADIDQNSHLAFDALAVGALDIVNRPMLPETSTVQDDPECHDFLSKLKLLSQVKVITHIRGKRFHREPVYVTPDFEYQQNIVVIASSTGGPKALREIFKGLPEDFSASIVVVQHMSDGFIPGLVSWLDEATHIPVKIAEPGERLKPATIYIAPTGIHLKIDQLRRFLMVDLPPIAGLKPSADILFESAARVFGSRVLGVILTGMGSDGTRGCSSIKEYGGRIIAQDESSSVISSMPLSAIKAGHVDVVKPLQDISREIQHQLVALT